jgi:hypothetical protein
MADQFDGEKATTLVMGEAAPKLSPSEFAWLRRQVEPDPSRVVAESRSKYIRHQGAREKTRRKAQA